MERFAKTVNGQKLFNFFRKTLHLRCLIGHRIRHCISLLSSAKKQLQVWAYNCVAFSVQLSGFTMAVLALLMHLKENGTAPIVQHKLKREELDDLNSSVYFNWVYIDWSGWKWLWCID